MNIALKDCHGRLPRKGSTQFICPSCESANLSIDKSDVKAASTAYTKQLQLMTEWEDEWTTYVFSAFLRCTNTSCGEVVVCSGNGGVELYQYLDNEGHPCIDYEDVFVAHYFHPCLMFFKIPEQVNEPVKKELLASFSLYFCDFNGAANHIRSAIEHFLTHLKIPSKKCDKNKLNRLSLHRRIELLPSKYKEIKDMLMAIKIIGNQGSHGKKQ